MGATRIVVYAEGAGETAGELRPTLRAGDRLDDDALGVAHLLIRRALASAHARSERAFQFEEGLRDRRGKVPKGSQLLHPQTIRQLLTWPRAEMRPDLAIVLVDCDGDTARKRFLEGVLAAQVVTRIVAMAVQEFEAWLIGDPSAISAVLGPRAKIPAQPETLSRRQARELLDLWIDNRDRAEARRELARLANLETLSRTCPSFQQFQTELSLLHL